MTNLEIYKIVREIVLQVTGVPNVIRSNPNAPSPDGEYCAISVTQTTRQRSEPAVRMKNIPQAGGYIGVRHELVANCETDVSINFYRGNAHEYARKMFGANKLPSISELLYRKEVRWLKSSAVNNLNALQSENWESRAQLSVTMMYKEISFEDTNAIYKVPIQIQDENGDVIVEDISITPV